MRKLYEKKELLFAIAWIVLYCVIVGTIRGNFGDESIWNLAGLLVFAGGITAFVKANHLEEKYGLDHWPKNTKRYLWFIPMWILVTGNLWDGFAVSSRGIGLVIGVLSMILVGYVEEMIFRGFLFKALLAKDKVVVAIVITAVTFGVGHIVNLFTGQASFETFVQMIFAVSWGFLLTMVMYKGKSILPCIIAHSLIDAFSFFSTDSEVADWIYVISTIVVSGVYCIYLARVKEPEEA